MNSIAQLYIYCACLFFLKIDGSVINEEWMALHSQIRSVNYEIAKIRSLQCAQNVVYYCCWLDRTFNENYQTDWDHLRAFTKIKLDGLLHKKDDLLIECKEKNTFKKKN